MIQSPTAGSFLLKWCGDVLTITLKLDTVRKGRAAFRTNLGNAAIRRREIIAETEDGITPVEKDWSDIPMREIEPGLFAVEVKLEEVGVFSGKACFFPADSNVPEWPEGGNLQIKVESAEMRANNSIYCVFPRQFGSFREVVRRLPLIMDKMGFRIIQTLPPFPVPTTYAVMGEYGCPFAATDFLSVDPAMAEFDERATPLDQFKELIGAVHARKGLMFVDLPANHTGWGSVLQTHHPDWFKHEADGTFKSPGAWGVKWADLVELDYTNAELRAYMADVFLFWCRNGIDGFRCDAGYMIPAETWKYIVAKVREEYPDTIFMLEGLGGELAVTDELLARSNLDWAYSEIFQTYDRGQFEWYLPNAIERSEKYGTLVHFAETHDNDRLAKGGEVYARLRVQLASLLSWQGAWGIANGVEWYCQEKIDVHGRNDLWWGAPNNMVDLIGKLNAILKSHPSYSGSCKLRLITRGDGNTLAVVRQAEQNDDDLLVIANLDCNNQIRIDWDHSAFNTHEAIDLITGRTLDASATIGLAPGEVMCLSKRPHSKGMVSQRLATLDCKNSAFHIVMPRDKNRMVVVPEGQAIEVSAAAHFRVRLTDLETGKTLQVKRSIDNRAVLTAPKYSGDGTACKQYRLDFADYGSGASICTNTMVLVPPSAKKARVKLALSGDEVRKHPNYRAILSNGNGAASQLRVGWGNVQSQYDAILAANLNPNVPSDRLNVWTRTRCWLQREGYVRALDETSIVKFEIDPAGKFAKWDFCAPCGMGQEASFEFVIALAEGRNVARLKVKRVKTPKNDAEGIVRLVFRPDLEWRSFHATTKAYEGDENRFGGVCRVVNNGIDFSPREGTLNLRVDGGEYHHEPEWAYCVSHQEEADRGQSGSGDVFSPGWISADLKIGDEISIRCGVNDERDIKGEIAAGRDLVNFSTAMKEALNLYIVKRDELKTVIAGYPWFLDWGRDTFIFMRGMIAAGMYEDSAKILTAFAAFEEDGTLPNIIYGKTAGNRDTTDAQLWFVRCVEELQKAGGKVSAQLLKTCNSIVDNYIKGTPNGIHLDANSGLIWSPSHFTWMDTNYPACTPRVGYPVEIQALWISALKFLRRDDLANRAKESLERLYKWEFGYRDCLAAPNGEPADAAIPEDTIRPNQLFLITLGVCEDAAIVRATEELLVPGGIRSLNSLHPAYRGTYAGDEDTMRKPSYHNGTVWGWVFPSYAEAMAKLGIVSRDTALALLAGAVENINANCIGHISEVADGDAPHNQKGCCAQAWSDSELLRVWIKLSEKKEV